MTVTKVNADVLDLTDAYALSGAVAFSGTVTGAGGMNYISSVTASSSASVVFTGLTDTYDVYEVQFVQVLPATDNTQFSCNVSQDGGASYLTGSNYKHSIHGDNSAGGTSHNYSATQTKWHIASNTSQGNAAAEHLNGRWNFYGLADGQKPTSCFSGGYGDPSGNNTRIHQYGSYHLNTSAVNALRFTYASGNIASGKFHLYGISKT
tara:strand:- start:213 stop:833 length:621 start_codon:yes stop_codon:yes gene_type:complete